MGHGSSQLLLPGRQAQEHGLIQILATFGLQVPEPVSEDGQESFVHCILQWLVREELIFPPLKEENMWKIVRHFFKHGDFPSSRGSSFSFPIALHVFLGRYLHDCALYNVSQGKGNSSDNCGVHFLFDKDRFETQPRALAVYDRGMLHNFLNGGFPRASLHPHPAHKKVALLLRSKDDCGH